MAKKLDEVPKVGATSDVRFSYNWAEWSDGDAWELVRGEDYPDDVRLRKAAYQYAASKKMKAHTKAVPGGMIVWFERPLPVIKKVGRKKIRKLKKS